MNRHENDNFSFLRRHLEVKFPQIPRPLDESAQRQAQQKMLVIEARQRANRQKLESEYKIIASRLEETQFIKMVDAGAQLIQAGLGYYFDVGWIYDTSLDEYPPKDKHYIMQYLATFTNSRSDGMRILRETSHVSFVMNQFGITCNRNIPTYYWSDKDNAKLQRFVADSLSAFKFTVTGSYIPQEESHRTDGHIFGGGGPFGSTNRSG